MKREFAVVIVNAFIWGLIEFYRKIGYETMSRKMSKWLKNDAFHVGAG